MFVFSLSMSVVSLPRLYLTEFGSHAFLLNFLVFYPYIVCSLLQDTAMTLRKYKSQYLNV